MRALPATRADCDSAAYLKKKKKSIFPGAHSCLIFLKGKGRAEGREEACYLPSCLRDSVQ